MIGENFKRNLTGKVADALVRRLRNADNAAAAKEDLDRLRRLYVDGQISNDQMIRGLEVYRANSSITDELRSETEAELNSLLETSSQGFRVSTTPSNTPTHDSTLAAQSTNIPYQSANVIVPASVDLDAIPSSGWNRVTGSELAIFLSQIGPVDGVIRVVPETTNCHWILLPWYDNVALIRITDPTWRCKKLALYYLTNGGNLYRLNGSSPPIHEVNAKAPIRITQENALDYLRFFCFFVRGDQGPFYVAESIEDPMLPVIDDREIKAGLETHFAPARYLGLNENGDFLFQATVYYANAIFKADFAVKKRGFLEMLEDSPLLGNLPACLDAPITQ